MTAWLATSATPDRLPTPGSQVNQRVRLKTVPLKNSQRPQDEKSEISTFVAAISALPWIKAPKLTGIPSPKAS